MVCSAAVAFLVVLLIAGCSPIAAEPPTPESLCLEGPVTAVLQVDADDPRVIWATHAETGRTFDLRLPTGYGVTADDQIIDPEDRVIGRTGDMIVSGCADIIQDALVISEDDIRRAPEN